MRHDGVASGYPTPTSFCRLTGCQRDPRDRGVTIIPIMVLLSSFVRSLTLWWLSKLSKKKLNSNKGRRSKWLILIEVVSIMVDMMRHDATLNHL